MRLVYFSLAFVLGIYLGSHYSLSIVIAMPSITAAIFVAILGRKRKLLVIGVICIAVFLCGSIRFGALSAADELQPYVGTGEVEIIGVVSKEPEPRDESSGLIISTRELNGAEVSGTLLVRAPRYPAYQYGDLLQISGELEQPPDDLDGFNYRAYLESQGIYATMYHPYIELLASRQGPQPLQALYSFRHRMGEALKASLAEPEGSLARATLLGLRYDIPDSLNQDFQSSGTAHLIAISGLNMAIVAGIVLGIAVRLFGRRRPTYFVVTLLVLWLYAVLAGMSPPVARAAIMVSIFLLGAHLGRQGSSLTAICFAAAVMVAIDPHILWQVSFQLSFGAVLGLILLTPVLQRWAGNVRLGKISLPAIIVDSCAYGLGAIIMTLPLVAYSFGYVSLVSLPATFFAALALPYTIVLSAIIGFIGLVSLPVAQVIGWSDWLFLKYTTLMVHGFAALDYSSAMIGQFNAILVWVYYAVLGGIIWLGIRKRLLFPSFSSVLSVGGSFGRSFTSPPRKNTPARWVILPLLVVAALIWAAAILTPQGDKLSISFLDVGQGDSILITSPSGAHVLIDGGPSPEKVCAELGEALPFWERTIDIAILTHPHDDHACGLVEVLQRYDVGQLLYPDVADSASETYTELLSVSDEKDIPRLCAEAGQSIDLGGGATIEVLHPQTRLLQGTDSDADNNGVVLHIEMGEISFLLAGDLHFDGELYLVCQRPKLESTILKASHHGSNSSTCPLFLAAVDPQVAVISVGVNNSFGHPHGDVMLRLKEEVGEDNIYLTSQRGTITFTTDGERLWVEAGR